MNDKLTLQDFINDIENISTTNISLQFHINDHYSHIEDKCLNYLKSQTDMPKLDQLIIRACKVDNSYKRLNSIYRRFYLKSSDNNDPHIVSILSTICDKYLDISISEFINLIDPSNDWKMLGYEEGKVDHHKKLITILISKIRYTNITKFPGLSSPAKFRNV